MENRIKEQLSLFSDRLSTEKMRPNQLRLYFSSLAYVLLHALRRIDLRGTEWAPAQAGTLRLRLLQTAAHLRPPPPQLPHPDHNPNPRTPLHRAPPSPRRR